MPLDEIIYVSLHTQGYLTLEVALTKVCTDREEEEKGKGRTGISHLPYNPISYTNIHK